MTSVSLYDLPPIDHFVFTLILLIPQSVFEVIFSDNEFFSRCSVVIELACILPWFNSSIFNCFSDPTFSFVYLEDIATL